MANLREETEGANINLKQVNKRIRKDKFSALKRKNSIFAIERIIAEHRGRLCSLTWTNDDPVPSSY